MGRESGTLRADSPGAMAARDQYGALCWRMHGGKPEVLLITSRDTGRWVIPKGWPIKGRTPAEAAAREAWEEAGAEGSVVPASLGSYSYAKGLAKSQTVTCKVDVFPLRVERLSRRFPERGERRRKWFSLEKASHKVDEQELRALILGFAPQQTVTGAPPQGD